MSRLFLVSIVGMLLSAAASGQADERRLREPAQADPYGRRWALIVGINYANRAGANTNPLSGDSLQPLKNAVADATSFAETLKTYYRYGDGIKLLTEEQATQENILRELGNFLDSERVSENDSVLVYFSGHGVRTGSDQSGTAFLAYDFEMKNGRPLHGELRLQQVVIDKLKDCPARHKLLILDHCYSGDIFNLGFQPRSSQNRGDDELLQESAFQAMASCRATQVAEDGSQGDGNSPFTSALIDGLTRLPANGDVHQRVWADRLLDYMAPKFKVKSQKPDCRHLIGSQGEFSFIPDPAADFTKFRLSVADRNMLTAMASRKGGWWFDERPWFIPGVRELVLTQWAESNPNPRSAERFDEIDEDALKKAAQDAFRKRSDQSLATEERYFQMLLSTFETVDFKATMEFIRDDLLKRQQPGGASGEEVLPNFTPTDQHLLAIVQHALGDPETAEQSYLAAIERYRDFAAKTESTTAQLQTAFCLADYGELLLDSLHSAPAAADQYRQADLILHDLSSKQEDAAAVFRTSILCQEAKAYLSINHWDQAQELLDDSLQLAKTFAADSYFHAQVHRERAWAQIMRWKIDTARRSFEDSNAILAQLMTRQTSEEQPGEAEAMEFAWTDENAFLASRHFHLSHDFASKVAYLHNLHGIAMAVRFGGDTELAYRKYLSLAQHVEETLADFMSSQTNENLEGQLVGRIINTVERLGDCNLFGNPNVVDLKQAIDDYRRARSWVHRLSVLGRDRTGATLLHKSALAFAIPNGEDDDGHGTQDTEMALELAHRADALFQASTGSNSGLNWILSELTTKTVQMLHEATQPLGASPEKLDAARQELREKILDCRDQVGQYPHRDELEVLLFTTKLLLEHGRETNRLQRQEDCALLLSFCRLALDPYRVNRSEAPVESITYLRPYYDAVLRAKLSDSSHRVLELLEIQSEATLGVRYVKSPEPLPVLAAYILDGECLLLIDLPRGDSRVVSTKNIYDVSTIKSAYLAERAQLELPLEAVRCLDSWRTTFTAGCPESPGEPTVIDFRWEDPVNLLTRPRLPETDGPAGAHVAAKPILVTCPLALPKNFIAQDVRDRPADDGAAPIAPPAE